MSAQRPSLLNAAVPAACGAAATGLLLVANRALLARPAGLAAGGLAALGVGVAAFAAWRSRPAPRATPARSDDREPRAGARWTARPRPTPRGDVVSDYLRDVRDALGASEAVFWQLGAEDERLSAAAWASGNLDAPNVPADDEVLGLVAWSAHEQIVQCSGDGEATTLASAPVYAGSRLVGALSLHAPGGLSQSRERAKVWLGRHATRLGELVELVQTKRAFDRHAHSSQRVVAASQQLHSARSVAALAQEVCAAAIEITGATRVALVQWSVQPGGGLVVGSAGDRAVATGQVVDGNSYVGALCREGLPQVWEDARLLDQTQPVMNFTEGARVLGALGVVPLQGRDDVVGALVLESDVPGGVDLSDVRSVKLLAAVAAGPLQTLGAFEAAHRSANTDQLTGLPNRRAFDAEFGPTLDRADRSGESVALLVCDVDHFKMVNDTHGHDAGDEVLRSLASVLGRGVRTIDTCARFGGEEFTLLLPRTGRSGAMELGERLRRAIESRPIRVAGRDLRITISVGVAIYPATVTSRDGLFAAADRALYQAKRDGRNCVRCADATAVFD